MYLIKASLIQFSPFSSTVSTCQNLTRGKKLKRIGGGWGGGDTRIPVYMVSFSEITTECLGFPSLRTKPSDSKYSSLTPASPLNYTEALPTTETPTNRLAIHLGSHALQQLPIAELRDITQIQRNGIRRAGHTGLPRGRETRPGKSALLNSLGTIRKGGFLEGRRTEEPKWGNPSLSTEEGWIPSRRLQPVPLRKRIGGQRALSSERKNCRHFPRSGCKPIPRLPGETRGVPWVTEEMLGS